MLLGCNDAVMGPANSPCTLMYYSMYNEQYDLFPFMIRFPSGNVVPVLTWDFNVTSLVHEDLTRQRYG